MNSYDVFSKDINEKNRGDKRIPTGVFSRRVIEGEANASIVKVNTVLRHDPIAALLGIFIKVQREPLMLYTRSVAIVSFEINIQAAVN